MRPRALLGEAAAALAEHKLRSGLSALGIVIAVLAVVAMLAVAEGAKRVTLAQLGRLGARTLLVRAVAPAATPGGAAPAPGAAVLAPADAEALERLVPALELAAPVREVAAPVGGAPPGEAIEVLAVTAAYARAADLAVGGGRFLADPDAAGRALVCVLGAGTARLLGPAGRVGADVRIADRLYRVVGVLEEQRRVERVAALAARDYNRAVLVPLGAEPGAPVGLPGEPPSPLAEVLVLAREGAPVEAAAEAVRAALALRHGGAAAVQVVVPRAIVRQAQRTQGVFNLVLAAIAAISLLVGGIGIMNIMLASVAERTREIGVRRAVGADRRAILLQFLAEAALLTLAGGAAGALAGVGGAGLVTALAGWPTAPTWWSLALGVGMALVVGLASGLYPAVRAARLDPVAALRGE